jgi:RNA polymerase sigma-70 factor (ECF subfamily)
MPLPLGSADGAARSTPAEIVARDRDWAERIRAGDTAAFEAMVRAYADPLFGYAYTFVRSRDVAEELVQDLFVRLWSQRETWDVPRSLLSYLFQATRNRAVSYLRHARVERRFRERALLGEDASTLGPRPVPADESARVEELSAAIARAVAAMPQRCREVFTLSREQQLTYPQIAEALQISVKTVEIHMGRALAMLRAALASWNQ